MENDFWTALKKVLDHQPVSEKGKQCTLDSVYSEDGVLLTFIQDFVDWWKKYSSIWGTWGWALIYPGLKLPSWLKKLLGGSALGVNEIHLEFIKALDGEILDLPVDLCS